MAVPKKQSRRTVRADIADGAEQFPVVVRLAAHVERRMERRRRTRAPKVIAA